MKNFYICLTALVLIATFASSTHAHGQQTTTTNCTLNGNTANCTSDTTDYGAQQRRAYEQGQQLGNALGQGLAIAMQRHSFNKNVRKYCAIHPGEQWRYTSSSGQLLSTGQCSTDEERGSSVAHNFMSRPKDFVPEAGNAKLMTTYLEDHRLNPLDEKSFEHAYKDLKKDGKLELYSR